MTKGLNNKFLLSDYAVNNLKGPNILLFVFLSVCVVLVFFILTFIT